MCLAWTSCLKIVSAAGTNRVKIMHEWNSCPDFDEASQQVADFLARKIDEYINEKGICHVILPGGNTPVESLKLLSQKSLAWDKVHWYPGDERCLPRGDAERNDLMLENVLWSKMPKTHIHRIAAEQGAEHAARQYREEIKNISSFDIAYLGMGEDGHTASLFPGHPALEDHHSIIPVHDSPKPPPDRVSFSLDTLQKTKTKVVLVAGSSKAPVIKQIKSGESLPINRIGDIHWFIDTAANKTET